MNPLLLRSVCRTCQNSRPIVLPVVQVFTNDLVRQRRVLSLRSISIDAATRRRGLCRRETESTTASGLESTSVSKNAYSFPDPESALNRLIADTKRICSSAIVPDQQDVLKLLDASRQLSEILIYGKTDRYPSDTSDVKTTDSPTSSILGLDESTSERANAPPRISESFRERASTALAKGLHDLVCDPKVDITLPMLEVYVHIQVVLGKPEFLPEVFHLYAHKPVPHWTNVAASISSLPEPTPPQSPTRFSSAAKPPEKIVFIPPSPNHPRNAIPTHLASAALTSSIVLKSLPLALSIIDTTFATPCFRRAKILNTGLLPLTALSLTPFCAYAISSYVAHHWQNTYDPVLATWMCTAGIMAYVASTATMGFVALTTSNDQMERVVWRPGMGLLDRWLREDERAAFDRIALAWGFKEKWRRGEERGEDWEALREFCARRGMVLDKTDLIDGMN